MKPLYSFVEARFLITNLDTPLEHAILERTVLEDFDNYSASQAVILLGAIKESRKNKYLKWVDSSLSEMLRLINPKR